MAKRKNPLVNKLNKSFQNHAQDETEYGRIDLPPGISAGIAQLVDGRLGEYKTGVNVGEAFAYLAGVVVEPKEHTYIPKLFDESSDQVEVLAPVTLAVEGQRTSVMIPLCDTTSLAGKITSVDDHVSRLLNELRKLGGDTSEIGSLSDFEEVMSTLVEVGPYFKFNTTSGNPTKTFPEPRTWENWLGDQGLEDYEPGEVDDVVDDTEGDEEPEDPEEKEDEEDEEKEDEEEGEEEGEEVDYEALGEAADDEGDQENEAAIDFLTTSAEVNELDPDDYGSWADLALALSDIEEPDEDVIPAKDEVFGYKPPKGKKAVDVLVTQVSKKTETCTLQNLEDGSTMYKKVPWSDLIAQE